MATKRQQKENFAMASTIDFPFDESEPKPKR